MAGEFDEGFFVVALEVVVFPALVVLARAEGALEVFEDLGPVVFLAVVVLVGDLLSETLVLFVCLISGRAECSEAASRASYLPL